MAISATLLTTAVFGSCAMIYGALKPDNGSFQIGAVIVAVSVVAWFFGHVSLDWSSDYASRPRESGAQATQTESRYSGASYSSDYASAVPYRQCRPSPQGENQMNPKKDKGSSKRNLGRGRKPAEEPACMRFEVVDAPGMAGGMPGHFGGAQSGMPERNAGIRRESQDGGRVSFKGAPKPYAASGDARCFSDGCECIDERASPVFLTPDHWCRNVGKDLPIISSIISGGVRHVYTKRGEPAGVGSYYKNGNGIRGTPVEGQGAQKERSRGRCSGCGSVILAPATRPVRIKCPRCGKEATLK